ncbi:hypothetical protein EEB14_33330 [Rhodococcus sp. WS4]|nr:hypothetical protein EEB14_33330 [Rhodococcus sp. WS4]
MAVTPNTNPESAALLGDSWISYDEDLFRHDATGQNDLSEAANSGSGTVAKAGVEAAETIQGAAGSALQANLVKDSGNLGSASDRHAAVAGHLEEAASNIEQAKRMMNETDDSYHAQKTAMMAQATAEGWTPAEVQLAGDNLLAGAKAAIANIRSGFEGAHEGVLNSSMPPQPVVGPLSLRRARSRSRPQAHRPPLPGA